MDRNVDRNLDQPTKSLCFSNFWSEIQKFFSTMCDRTGGNADFTFFHDFYTKIGEYKEKKFVKYEGLYRIFLRDTIFEEER